MRASRDQLMGQTARRRRATVRTLVTVVLTGALALTAAGCTSGSGGNPAWQGGAKPTEGPKASATITSPAADAKDVPASTEIAFSSKDATETTFELKDGSGKVVEGKLKADGTTWLPNGALDYGTTYTATVTATGDDNKPATATSTFTTMANPANQIRVTSFLGDGAVVGVGMPLIVKFSRAIPQDYRDDLQGRMTVTATPAQEGAWRWISSTEVHYRPKTFWQANTTLAYKIQAGGLPLGDGWYGRSDLTIDAKIGSSVVMTVDNKNKQMIVTKDGKTIKTIPVSLGAPATPSSSGTMVVVEKLTKTIFDTMDDPNPANRYRTPIEFAQRLTWGGEFIHAAPWSVSKQGNTNVSHGCVNMSQANAQWLYGQTQVGDPITVKGTERKLQDGNGWTDWNMSWDDYIKGSAIPYAPPAPPTPSATPSADLTATPTT